jgi:hypothetical protein
VITLDALAIERGPITIRGPARRASFVLEPSISGGYKPDPA